MAQAQVQTLGGHAFPVDERILLMAKRLGLVEQNADHATLRGILEKNIPKAQIHLAIGLIEEFVDSICTLTDPKCPVCRFKSVCPAYEAMLNPPKVKAKEEPKKLDKPGSRPTPEKPSKSVKAIPGSSKPKSLAGQASDAPAASAEKPLKDGGSPKAASKPVPKKAASGSDSKTSAPKPNAPAKSAAEKTKESAKSVSPSKLTSGATKPIEKPESAKSAANAKPPVKKAQASAKSTKSVPKKSK